MRITAADYLGLMAYLFVMHGGIPDDTPVLLEEYRKVRQTSRTRPRARKRGRLRVIEGGRARETHIAARAGRSPDADEDAA